MAEIKVDSITGLLWIDLKQAKVYMEVFKSLGVHQTAKYLVYAIVLSLPIFLFDPPYWFLQWLD